ncbi:MAG TPA: ribosome biogenesis GTP-binding protein YihA/YsxC [Thermoanaerobaculia bacterium]|nr:ribosome biogenesis GTP-binding protein YihA/YsxC [Thermoanaerobaculia bacterium]
MEIKSVEFHRAAYQAGDFPRDERPQFAMVGRSNVGKSSLINAVLNRKQIARVSQTPGKTQAIHFYLINGRFYLVDLPGYGYAKVPRNVRSSWGDLVRGYLDGPHALRLIFLLLDVRRDPADHDLQMHDWSRAAGIDERVVLTKSDKLSNNELAKRRAEIARELDVAPDALLAVSAVTRRGIEDVRREIASRL